MIITKSIESYSDIFDVKSDMSDICTSREFHPGLLLGSIFGITYLAIYIAFKISNKHTSTKINEFISNNKELIEKIKNNLKRYKQLVINDLKSLNNSVNKVGFSTDFLSIDDKEYKRFDDFIKNIDSYSDDKFYDNIVGSIKTQLRHKKELDLKNVAIMEVSNDDWYVNPKWEESDFEEDGDDSVLPKHDEVEAKYTKKLNSVYNSNKNNGTIRDIEVVFPNADYSPTYEKPNDYKLCICFDIRLDLDKLSK
jgi:hypothetical protein